MYVGYCVITCVVTRLFSCAYYTHRDQGYVKSSDLNIQCVHNKPNSSHSIPYLTQCYYEAFIRRYILEYLGLKQMRFLPPESTTWADIAPTWNDTVYRHQVMQVNSE